MSVYFARTDTSVLGRWWWTVDRWTLAALAALVGFGALLIFAASPPAAARIDLDSFHFVRLQLVYLPLAFGLMLAVSLMTPRSVKRTATLVFILVLALTALTLVVGAEHKGAQRWLSIANISVQPSEFLKPTFAVVAAWMFASGRLKESFHGGAAATLACALIVGLLLLQPDFGMAGSIVAIWLAEFFLAGLSVVWIVPLMVVGAFGLLAAYLLLPHVAKRVDTFLDPASGDSYQIDTALEAFTRGGLFGRGPGEGTVKAALPDAHSDFVFAVAGEEFGLVACLLIVGLYAFVVLRGFSRAFEERDLFILLASAGLLAGFGLQALVNMASALNLVPTKGMTLPFISYGGSSLLALGLGMGMVLALTRRRAGVGGMT